MSKGKGSTTTLFFFLVNRTRKNPRKAGRNKLKLGKENENQNVFDLIHRPAGTSRQVQA
jgi:hypothetical protein